MKIFLSGTFRRRADLQELAAEIEAHGHEITSSWLKPETDKHDDNSQDPADWRKWGEMDLRDIDRSEMFVLVTEPTYELEQYYSILGKTLNGMKRGGRHFEMGYAAAMGKIVVILGPYENVFHPLFDYRYDTLDELLFDILEDVFS